MPSSSHGKKCHEIHLIQKYVHVHNELRKKSVTLTIIGTLQIIQVQETNQWTTNSDNIHEHNR